MAMNTTEKSRSSTAVSGAGEELADVLELAHPGHRVADAPRLEVGEGQLHQVPEEPRAELDVDAARGVREHVGAHAREHRLEERHGEEADADHRQGAVALVHQHLVHHHLEEERCGEREELDEERGDQHLAEQPAVLHDRRDEPGEVEAGELGGRRGAGGDQHDGALPLRGEVRNATNLRTRIVGIYHKELLRPRAGVRADPGEDQPFTITQVREDGKREMLEAIGPGARGTCLQTKAARGEHEGAGVDLAVLQRVAVRDLIRVGGEAVSLCKHRERGDAGRRVPGGVLTPARLVACDLGRPALVSVGPQHASPPQPRDPLSTADERPSRLLFATRGLIRTRTMHG